MDLCIFCELRQHHLVHFSGDDAQSFLNNLLSCDVAGLDAGRSTYGSFCTPKGRVLATFLLWGYTEGYLMQLPAALREPIQKRLSMYILRSKVRTADASGRFAQFGVAGEGAGRMLARLFGDAPAAPHDVLHRDGAMLIGLPPERYLLVVPADKSPAIRTTLLRDAAEMTATHWDWLDIRAGIPAILPETQDQFVPQMMNLDLIGAVSFGKGCYPGQEIVARTHFLGRLKQRMYRAHVDPAPAPAPRPGDRLHSADLGEQASGTIVNAAPAPEGGHDVLAVIQIGSAAGGDVHLRSLDGPRLTLLPLPYPVT